mgnify:CR=1 FL=1
MSREKLEKIEQERQEEILSEFQEFKGLREEDEDLINRSLQLVIKKDLRKCRTSTVF